MTPAPNTPGRRTASEIAVTLRDVMTLLPARLHALRALKLRTDHPLLPLLADPAQFDAEMPAPPERPALGHDRGLRSGARTCWGL